MTTRSEILNDILAERQRQDDRGHSAFDKMNNPEEWRDTIHDYNAWAHNRVRLLNPPEARDALVKAAAVIVAYIEILDAEEGK